MGLPGNDIFRLMSPKNGEKVAVEGHLFSFLYQEAI